MTCPCKPPRHTCPERNGKRKRVETRKWAERVADPKTASRAKEGDRLRPRVPHPGLVALLERAKDEGRLDEAAGLLAGMFMEPRHPKTRRHGAASER